MPAKFTAGSISAIYALALFGGILADATSKYKTVILFGIIIMFGRLRLHGNSRHVTDI
ncbi:MAG: hypothetical protein MZV63_08855 [Marinilabiliales bacterium]|nr:hypothetical protein [Marinilabiliales bacterium]